MKSIPKVDENQLKTVSEYLNFNMESVKAVDKKSTKRYDKLLKHLAAFNQ